METEELKKALNWWDNQITPKLKKHLTIESIPSKKLNSLTNEMILKIYKKFMVEDLKYEDEIGVCNKCGATQLLSYNKCNYNGICNGIVIPIVYRICDYCTSFKTDEKCDNCLNYSNWKAWKNINELVISDAKKILKNKDFRLRKLTYNKGKSIIPEWYIEKKQKNQAIILIEGPIYDEILAHDKFEEIINKAPQQKFIEILENQNKHVNN